MSNKTLIAVIVILVLAAGGFAAWRINSQKSQDQSSQEQNMQDATNEQEQIFNETTENTLEAQDPKTEANACVRNFDSEKLKTAKVEIKNRQVEIDVKGFGKIVLEFYDTDAPKTVENFLRLTNAGYFDCLTFHRVAKGFVVQGGDPTGTGSGGDSAFGGEFADEIKADSPLYQTGYKKGVVAMANRGPNTNTSQFFIMLSDAGLPPSYTIFGNVVSGLDTVDKIGQVEIVPQLGPTDGAPKVPVVMETVKIVK